MHTCSLSVTRTPPSRPSVIAAASVIPPVLPTKVSLVHSLADFAAFVEANPRVSPGGEASEDTAQEDFQYKLKGFIDSTVDKRWETGLNPLMAPPP